MSLAATLRPSTFSLTSPSAAFRRNGNDASDTTRSFFHEPAYLNLTRMLNRFSHLILLTTPSVDSASSASTNDEGLTALQQQTQAELYSPLPFHRTKWLHNIEGARDALLKLERMAVKDTQQAGGRARQSVQRDLADKRGVVRRLRLRVEEIGREVEGSRADRGNDRWVGTAPATSGGGEATGETLYDLLVEQRAQRRKAGQGSEDVEEEVGRDTATHGNQDEAQDDFEQDRTNLLSTSSTIRRRDKNASASSPISGPDVNTGTSTGISSHEKQLHASSRDQEALTTSLVSLAAQLKQQTRAFQFSLDQDKGLLNRALEGLDKNISGMEAASKNMQFLKRMSEGEGWFGRMKLYAIIFGMWVAAVLLVFVGPKLRF